MISISIKDAGKVFLRNCALAVTVMIIAFLGLEWLMPGSVLPFFDIINILPLAFFLILATLVITRESGTFSKTIQIIFAVITTIALIFILFTVLDGSGYKSLMLVFAGSLCIVAWVYAVLTEP
ncbi:MAG: hypothetical protein ACOYUZ_02395 [Patescibacteria group bacterium]